ncbi:MAG: hypothetical protein DCC67_20105 [Planctomycetota bacterium]|nr:MAG: hypothetical protein DCC67_20105 [Planctomycetota bacterium]
MKPCSAILHVISRLDGYGGARMLRRLAAIQAAEGCPTTVAAMRAERSIEHELGSSGAAVVRLERRWTIDPAAVWRLSRLIRKHRPPVVHAWDVAAAAHVALAAGRRGPWLLATLAAPDVGPPWPAFLLGRLKQRIHAFAATDGRAAAALAEIGVPGQSITLIPPAAPPAPPSPVSRADLLAHFRLPADARLIAVAGPLQRRKEFDQAIWSFELLRVLHENAVLLVLGDGPDYERLERFADLVCDPGAVRLLGYRPDIGGILPHIDVFWQVSPTVSTPLAMLEVAAAGVPVVASDFPAHRAMVSHGRTGFLVPPWDRAEVVRATDALLGDPELTRRVGDLARTSALQHWPLPSALDSYRRLYEQACGKLRSQ